MMSHTKIFSSLSASANNVVAIENIKLNNLKSVDSSFSINE